MALLQGLLDMGPALDAELLAVHVDHGIHPASSQWADWCSRRCQRLGVAFCGLEARVAPAPGDSLEAAARHARYALLAEAMGPGDVLLTAHHRDDQAETLLLHLLRGSGVAGLAAMPACRPFGPGWLARPLLGLDRRTLRAYLEERGLDWLDDPGNADLGFDRNFLRHQVIPLLQQRWPGAVACLTRSARHCAEAEQLLQGQVAALLPALRPAPDQLALPGLAAQPLALRHQILRVWLKEQGCALPNSRQLQRLCVELVEAARDRNPVVAWAGHEVRRYRERLYLLRRPLPALEAEALYRWPETADLSLPGNGRLCLEPGGVDAAAWAAYGIEVRYRTGGERCRPGRNGLERPLKQLLQEAEIPPWLRPRVPLLFLDGELALAPGVCVGVPWVLGPGRAGARVRWEREGDGP